MRQDQFEKLQTLSEKLTDVFLTEAEPDMWPGHGMDPGSMTQQTRGDRYWCKKNAVATLSLIGRVASLTNVIRMQGGEPLPPGPEQNGEAEEDGLDAEIREAEKEAQRLLNDIQKGTKKAEFDKRVHGKS